MVGKALVRIHCKRYQGSRGLTLRAACAQNNQATTRKKNMLTHALRPNTHSLNCELPLIACRCRLRAGVRMVKQCSLRAPCAAGARNSELDWPSKMSMISLHLNKSSNPRERSRMHNCVWESKAPHKHSEVREKDEKNSCSRQLHCNSMARNMFTYSFSIICHDQKHTALHHDSVFCKVFMQTKNQKIRSTFALELLAIRTIFEVRERCTF